MSEIEIQRPLTMMSQPVVAAPKSYSDSAAGPALPAHRAADAIAEFDRDESLPPVPDHPRLIEVLMKNAMILIASGESKLAMNILRNVLMRDPNHAGALEQMGRCLRDAGRIDESLKCFRALTKSRKDGSAISLVAETLYLMERDRQALDAYREVLKTVINDEQKLFDVYKNVGNIHVRAGDFESAEEFYNKAYTLKPDSDVLMVNYGTLEIQRENFAAAVERFRRAVEINPENDRGWVGLAILHRQMGDIELATANVERALDINPSNRTALRLAVDWAAVDHRLGSVVGSLERYMTANGEDAEMAFTLSKVLVQVGRLREGRLELERALALDPMLEGGESLRSVLDREIGRMSQEG